VHLCWMSSVDPSFRHFISAMNLLIANSVLGTFSEIRLTNVIFFPHRRIATPIAMNRQSYRKCQLRSILSKRRRIRKEIGGKTRLRFKGVHLLEVFQSATFGFQHFVVTASSYERRTNVRVVNSGKGSDIRSGETSVREELADDNRTRTVTDVLT
jgi:hypothetical protein